MQDTVIRLDTQRNLLKECIEYLKKTNRQLAQAENFYRKELTKQALILRIKGYEGEFGKTEPIAITKADEIAKGLPIVADLRMKRDFLQGDVESTMQRIYACKLEIDILLKELEAIRKGE